MNTSSNVKEIWKKIPGFDNYSVSDLGRVRSDYRIIMRSDKKPHPVKEKILSLNPDTRRYLGVVLYKNKKRYHKMVHKLVMLAFKGHDYRGHKKIIDHIDEDKTNNRLDNLQITDNRHNILKSRAGKGTSEYPGVCWDKKTKKWVAQIYIGGFRHYLGRFEIEEDAAQAYINKLKKHAIAY